MKKLSDTIAELAALRATAPFAGSERASGKLQLFEDFGTNPGNLSAKIHVPATLASKAALVVVLHGCTQTAAGYDQGSGWSKQAEEQGFALLFPEQVRANNPNLCFNWFSPADNARGKGEALSIRQMIAAMIERYDLDASRVFITGLSAGGAMTSIMLATYPEVFAGGAIIAGLPFGSASNVTEALNAMRSSEPYRAQDLGGRVRQASGHSGPWPTISIWHGTADATVNMSNADAILAQWLSVHALDMAPDVTETVAGYPHRIWRDDAGRVAIEDYRLTGMGHGTPLATSGHDSCGAAAPYMLEAGLSSTWRILAAWGLAEQPVLSDVFTPEAACASTQEALLPAPRVARLERIRPPNERPSTMEKTRVHKVINDAFRAAGLLR